jgi:hypothetical protein
MYTQPESLLEMTMETDNLNMNGFLLYLSPENSGRNSALINIKLFYVEI